MGASTHRLFIENNWNFGIKCQIIFISNDLLFVITCVGSFLACKHF